MKRINTFRGQVVPCIPPNYNPLDICMREFESHFVPYADELLKDINKLDVYDLVQLVDWFDYFIGQVEVFELSKRSVCLKFNQMIDDLMTQYLFTIKAQVMQWFSNIKSQPVEVVRSTEGILITTTPEDMFNIIHMQIAVAKDRLSREHLKDVVTACLQVLRDVQRQSYVTLRLGWREMHPEMLCAMINDTQRMQEKSEEEFADTVIRLIPKEFDREMLTAILEEVSSEYIAIAIRTVNFLARCILEDLEEAAFSKIFRSEWESGKESLCPTITATLQDYFQDIKEWLQDYFYSRFVYECLNATVAQYVMCLRKYPPGTLQFSGELSAAKRIFDDMDEIMRMFGDHMSTLKAGGLKRKAEHESDEAAMAECLAPMAQLARIISATHFSGAADEAVALFDMWGADALQLVQCALSCNPSMDKNEKAENLDAAEKLFNKKRYTEQQQCDIYRSVEGSLNSGSSASGTKSMGRTASEKTTDQVSKLSGWKFRGSKNKDKK